MFTRVSLMLAAATVAATVSAREAPTADVSAKIAALSNKVSAVQKKHTRAEFESNPKVLAKTGGFMDVPAVGTAFVVVDARPTPGGAPERFAEVFGNLSKMNVKVEKTPLAQGTCPVEMLGGRLKAHKAGFGFAVVSDPKTSGLLVLPDERLVIVNSERFREGDDPVRREERVIKELWRGLGYVSGIGYAKFKNDVFQPAYTVAELDALEFQVMQPMNFMKMYATLNRFGVKHSRHIPYRVAVMEGWAPAPTNDIQKAVWDEVHAIPKKPVKIQYDKTKQKPVVK